MKRLFGLAGLVGLAVVLGCQPVVSQDGGPAPTDVGVTDGGATDVGVTDVGATDVGVTDGGATRPGQTAYGIRAIASGLDHPWGMAWLPDDSVLITERAGGVQHWTGGELIPVKGVPLARGVPLTRGTPPVFAKGQGGLLDVAIHPQFVDNQWVYFTYAAGTSEANGTQVARAKLVGNSLQDWEIIFSVEPLKPGSQHFGARLLWLPDGTLLVSIGDGGNPPLELDGALIRQQAQNSTSHLGKVLRLNDDGSVPRDNPVLPGTAAPSALWTYGHRNIQGLAYHGGQQQVWVTEHGARGGDELNRLAPGNNYGWPVVSHSREYHVDRLVSERQSQPGMVDPDIVWTPSIAPSGLAVYNGDAFPEWQGDLFAGALVNKEIRRIRLSSGGGAQEVEAIPIGQRVRDVRQGPNGYLYVLTDEDNGELLVIEPAEP
ncbi:PQQ-dependent sugar dehydrogenase [Leptothoe kymatousa TAU-MAC 1615]|uniref:PQQ-dependent sugar dehydrogenase n=2 Tax=Leptothoe TaxID=2651725 RepID=A0ABS5Y3P0_9CYAN|nr:PQQ-dependent sugar dehydrogenase [Leptothoe kymatousa TAU-MAC 1615]